MRMLRRLLILLLSVSVTVLAQDAMETIRLGHRLAGERVTLEIFAAHDTPGPGYGSAQIRHVATTVSGRLGEWLPLGGTIQQAGRDGRGLTGYNTAAGGENRQIWLKVDALD